MCFAEYVAYVCGHTSVAVNRPCPMTTHLHNNPVCPKPACRPFLAHTMCHPCTRIMHSRRVDIAEYEHRFMHERGACDCEVQFPALLQPRVVRRSSAVTEEDEAAATTENGVDAGTSTTDYALLQGELSPMSSCDIDRPSTQQNTSDQAEKATIPLFQESQVGEKVEIAVRLSSLYAAEWTGDHAELHKSGQCHCPRG
ncbi:hypothetical protein NUW58_g8631 [Xylaria curta]|uniref:Uncharacterized protein n=1 Tax=Xylaria curta TaxID=42375 RepID=A0ACC1N7D5_9PEZI|nr:hypothetical protein NUW58_g8631 [Xylaria curta]